MFLPGKWFGEGKICLNMLNEELSFFTRWTVGQEEQGYIESTQEIQVKGLSDVMVNYFNISDRHPASFSIFMENHAVGNVQGTGIIDKTLIGWEFRAQEQGFEGFEYYEKQLDGSYLVRGEFSTVDQLRTTIQGRIWKEYKPLIQEKS